MRRSLKRRLIFVSSVAALVFLLQLPAVWSHAADAPAVAKKFEPGLTLTFESSTGAIDARDARLVALLVPAGTPASALIPVGPFKATWTGVMTTRIKDSYRFAAEGRGDLSVTINEKPVLELHGGATGEFAAKPTDPIVIKKGKNRIVVTYKSPADGDASVRLLYAPEGKPMEPMPPTIFSHDVADDVLMAHSKIRMGREIFATMRCINCHQGVNGAMPELKQDAPNLSDVSKRLNAEWIAYWITNPKGLRPTASMPRVFHDSPSTATPGVDQRAYDIAAYLTGKPPVASVSSPTPDAEFLAHGARLFTGLGCVACHVAPGVDDSDPTLNRLPLKFVKEKFAPGELAEFLKKPEAHYAWIHMPNFHLSDGEANALSASLESRCSGHELPKITLTADAANGKKLFETSGCLNCHAAEGSTPRPAVAVDLAHADWTRGCVAGRGNPAPTGVDFDFTPDQQEALKVFAASEWKASLARDPLPEFAARQMIALRCNACHSIDSADNIWANLDTDISAIEQNLPARPASDPEPTGDQSRPPLTWTGEKLRPSWMESFIAGRISYKPRTWVFARMPSFASRAELLAKAMAMMQGCPVTDEVRPPVDPHLADIGRGLTAQTSFGCVKCHSCGDQAAIAPFEAFAPNLAYVADRLRHDYFTHWMRNPQHYLPGTKMPSFADADGNTAYKDILGGVAADQYEAIWQYLRAGEKIVPAQ